LHPRKKAGFYFQECKECTAAVPRSPLGARGKGQQEYLLCQKKAFNRSLDEQELLLETEDESHRLLMAPLIRFINKETQADTAQENARASHMKI
jgi:hypothetical protein